MKIAIVQDELIRRGGGEQVALYFHRAFPEAPIYTLAYRPKLTYSDFENCKIITSWFQKIAINEQIIRRAFFPLGILAMKQLDVSDFDIVLMSSTHCAKYVKVKKNALVINFCHCPFRLAWYPQSYYDYIAGKGIKKWILNFIIYTLRKIDYSFAQRVDYFIANTLAMAENIKTIYAPKTKVSVINPPVSCKDFYISKNIGDYYLVVSRFEYYKRVDLVIAAFNQLGLPLVIVGKGTYRDALMKQANKNITFKSSVDKHELAALYSQCKALVFPQREDYGITPLEANASGRPVIAFGEGGVLETMIPYQQNNGQATALFFDKQTTASIRHAVQHFQSLQFDPIFIRSHALRFDSPYFIEKIKSFVSCKKELMKM